MEDEEDDEDEEDKKLTEEGKEYKKLISQTTIKGCGLEFFISMFQYSNSF